MKPLIVLTAAFLLSRSGNIAMCAMLCFTAIGHFKFTAGMTQMIPSPLPYKRTLVYATGVLEPVLGAGLLFPATRLTAAIALLAMLILMLPANISAARRHLNYETGEPTGPGPRYLWFRIPLQLLFIAWTIFFSLPGWRAFIV